MLKFVCGEVDHGNGLLEKVFFLVQVICWLQVALWTTFRILVTVKFLLDRAILPSTQCPCLCMMKRDRGTRSALWKLTLEWAGLIEEP